MVDIESAEGWKILNQKTEPHAGAGLGTNVEMRKLDT
jgi:hypothetical protein